MKKKLIIDELLNEPRKIIFKAIINRVSLEIRYYIRAAVEEKIKYQTIINIAWKLDNRLERRLNEKID
jgi:hypothetical protein